MKVLKSIIECVQREAWRIDTMDIVIIAVLVVLGFGALKVGLDREEAREDAYISAYCSDNVNCKRGG